MQNISNAGGNANRWYLSDNDAVRLYRLLVHQLPDFAIFMMDPEGVITTWNEGVQRMLGYSHDAFIGKNVSMLLTPEDLAMRAGEIERELASASGSAPYRRWDVRKDGSRLYVDGVLSALRDESGKLLGFCKIMRDATHRKLAEDAVQRSYQNLSEFAHVVSHDLQAPLRAISAYTELFVQNCAGAGHADVLEWGGFIKDAVEQMRTLIQDLLEYAHILGKEVVETHVNLETVLKHVCKRLEPALKEAEAVVTHDPLPAVTGDETLLAQLFQNLIGNAMKYRSREEPRIHISASVQGDEWLIAVADNGIGIKADQQLRIFEPFKRLHGTELPGNGIGLAICKRIVERYGKRIWVASEEGQGATFYFTLPARG